MGLEIRKETAKAVLVGYDRFILFSKDQLPEGARVVEETEREALAAAPVETWLPKSQIRIEDGRVVEVADWLRKDRGLYSLEEVQEAVRATIEKIRAEHPRWKINYYMVRNSLPEEFTHPNLQDAVRFYVEKLKGVKA